MRVLLLDPQDNCVIACTPLSAGSVVLIDDVPLTLSGTIEVGHKLARRAISAGEKVIRYGAIIGTATHDIQRGEHIHLHNLKSDYLPTFAIGDPQAAVVANTAANTAANTTANHNAGSAHDRTA